MSRLKKLLGVIGLVLVLFLNGFAYADGLIRTFKGHNKNVNSVAFSPDGTMIVSGSNDDTIKLWDRKSGKLLNIIKGHKEAVKIVAFSPNGTMIASGSWDKTIKLWDTKSGRLLNTSNAKYRASSSLVFSPDGTIIAFSDYQIIKLWDIQSDILLRASNGVGGMFEDLSSMAFSPDGRMLVSAGSRSSIKLWNANSLKLLKTIRRNTIDFSQEDVDGIAFSPDGSMIASGGRSIKLWNVQSGRLLKELKSSKLISSIAFGSDGAMIASGSWDGTIKLRDIQSGRVFNILKGHKDRVNSIAISPDGTMIISGSSDNTVKLWDISPTNEQLARKVYKSIDKSDYAILYAFTKKFYNHLDIVQQAYRDMNKELIRMHQKAYDKAKEIDTVSAYNTFVFAYPYASQAKEANDRAYELEKKHYTDTGMLGFFSKDEKMNKQARNLLIEAQSILDIERNSSIIDAGYYIVVNRMYRLAKNEFANTDRVLTLKESPELKRFDKIFQKKLQERMDNIKKIESGWMGGAIELRVDSTKAVMSLGSSDSKMKEFYLEQNKESTNFETLYQKVLNEYRSEVKKERNVSIEKTENRSLGQNRIVQNSQPKTPLELAQLGRRYLSQKNYIKANSYFETACEKGNMASCHNLANSYIKGEGIEKNIQKAKELYTKSCNNKNFYSCNELIRIYTSGIGTEKDEERGIKLLTKLCNGDYAVACASLGVQYDLGITVEKNTKKANELYLKACNNGIVSGCFNLGNSYLKEFGINHNRELAKKYFNKACKKGNKKGCKWYKIVSKSSSEERAEREVFDLKKLKEATVPNDVTIAFWNDYGESISKISETLVLGNEKNHHESDYAMSKILLSPSQKEVKDLMKSSVLKYINTKKKINDVYLYLSYRMIKDFSTSKLTTLASERKVEYYTTNTTDNTNKIITFKNKMVFDTKKGKVDLGFKKGDVKYFIVTQNTKDNKTKLQSQLYSENGEYVVIYMKSYGKFVVMDTEAFNSTYVQMFILEKYDKNIFELVVSSPYSKIYKLKQNKKSNNKVQMLENDCKNGNGISCSKLGNMYEFGSMELKKDRKKAKDFYLKAEQFYTEACDKGIAKECNYLGVMYTVGVIGVSKDKNKAKVQYKKACDGGDEQACKNLRSRSISDSTPLQGTRNKSSSESINGKDSVNSNSSLVSKQKAQQQAQSYISTSNQLTNSERQELEQLRAEKAKEAQKKEANSKPVSQSQTSNSKSFQNTRTDSYETYLARISQKDHFGKRGQKLKDAGTILQQDRANYHKYYKRDREDRGDSRFGTRDNRDKIKRMLIRGSTSQKTLDAIRYGTPLVKVRIYKEHIDVTLESMVGQTRQRQHRKTSTQKTTVPVMIGGDPDLDACGATGVIQGISRRGDGFLAVRSGPGAKYKMIDKFYRNGAKVTMCDDKGKWVGIVYGKNCGEAYDNIAKRKPYEGSCKSGWIFDKYIKLIAG